jgi:NAD(P)-dependent dehydrogenase (short-subunit alcohol dehydrogenase family)
LQFGVNHIGHFELTIGLLPALKLAKKSRVVVLSSVAHLISSVNFDDIHFQNRHYDERISYGQSKTANVLFAVELTRRYSAEGIYSNAVMPGGILTGLQKHVSKDEMIKRGWIDENGNQNSRFKSIEQGASTSVWAAVAPELENQGGLYLEDCQVKPEVDKTEALEALKSGFKNGYPKGPVSYAIHLENAKKLWEISEKLVSEIP